MVHLQIIDSKYFIRVTPGGGGLHMESKFTKLVSSEAYGSESSGFAARLSALRQEGGSEAEGGFTTLSSGLETPTIRNTFPIIRTMGFISGRLLVEATLFLTA